MSESISGDNSSASVDFRLQQIENKLIDLQGVMVALARVEERTATCLENMEAIYSKIDKENDRITKIEQVVQNNARTTSTVERIGWLVITLIFTVTGIYIGYQITSGGK